MALTKENYKQRLVDEKISEYLKVFGAVSIEGPKWCGKTWTSFNHANSAISYDDDNIRQMALIDIKSVLNGDKPQLIDEWNKIPSTWDKVRNKCDEDTNKGKYILTCSTRLTDEEKKASISHSGAGRIARIKMSTMSLFESGDSSGKASILDMYNGIQESCASGLNTTLKDIINLIVRGGWPGNIETDEKNLGVIPSSYITAFLNDDINDDKDRDKNKMSMLLRSLARNESTVVSNQTLLKDIENYEENVGVIQNNRTIDDYLNVLDRLYLIENQLSYDSNYRSRERVGKSPKRHFTDPSLACAALGLTTDMLMNDLNTVGFMFESLVYRDLRIYMDYLNGTVKHFRDNVTGLEVDEILEFENGDYAAVEVKLGFNQVEEAKKNLLNFASKMTKKPKFLCVVVGVHDYVLHDEENNLYIIPITALKP